MGHPSYNYTLLYIKPDGSYTSLAPTNKNILDAYGVSINITSDGDTYTLTFSRNATGGTEASTTLGIALLIQKGVANTTPFIVIHYTKVANW